MAMKQALMKAAELDEKLTVEDFAHKTCVLIEHTDGSRLFYTNALLIKEGEFWMVFTEHHGYQVFHDEDCKVREFEEK